MRSWSTNFFRSVAREAETVRFCLGFHPLLLLIKSYADLTTSLCDAILETISSTSDMLETFMFVYAAFIVTCASLIGSEIGARFLQAALERLQSEYERTSQIAQSRNVVNMALLVSYLYTFGVLFASFLRLL